MEMDYRKMLRKVTYRMLFIKMNSLENELLNDEWNALLQVQGELIKLIKIQEKIKKLENDDEPEQSTQDWWSDND